MPSLLLATKNPAKLLELRALLRHPDLSLLSAADLGLNLEVAETGRDYAANAGLKARAFARAGGIWALGDDSGLEVDALDGAPGLHSARLIGPDRTDGERRAHLLQMLHGKPRPWKARFRSVVALAHPDGVLVQAEGHCAGEILPEERGQGGFGYDPIFLVQDRGQTMAELSASSKNRISHRARALQALWPMLVEMLGLEIGD